MGNPFVQFLREWTSLGKVAVLTLALPLTWAASIMIREKGKTLARQQRFRTLAALAIGVLWVLARFWESAPWWFTWLAFAGVWAGAAFILWPLLRWVLGVGVWLVGTLLWPFRRLLPGGDREESGADEVGDRRV